MKKSCFTDFNEFKRLSLARFWNEEKEREAYQKLQFDSNERGPRTEYFMKMLKESRHLSNKIEEADVVKLLINHFSSETKRGILILGLRSVDEIDEYLKALDVRI